MQIHCPKCHIGYQLQDNFLEDPKKKLKCSNCGLIFAIEDALPKEEENENFFESLVSAMAEVNETPSEHPTIVSENSSEKETLVSSPEPKPSVETPAKDVLSEEAETKTEAASEAEAEIKAESVTPSQDDTPEQDLTNTQEDTETNVQEDLEKIFERLSEHTENLIEREKKLPFYEKAWLKFKNILGFHFKISWIYILAFCLVYGLMFLYNSRYDIVRKAPFMSNVYNFFGIKAMIPGEGLEFQNINWEFLNDDEGSRLEIKGFINNPTERDIALPTIHIEILDKETSLLQSQNRDLDEKSVEKKAQLPLNLIIQHPAPTAKYVYMTFIDKQE